MGGHHDQVRAVLDGLVRDDLGRIALTQYSSSVEMIQRCTEKIVQLFRRLLSAILVECLYLWRKVINRGDYVQRVNSA